MIVDPEPRYYQARRDKAIASVVLFGTGSPMDSDLKRGLALGHGIGAKVLYTSGILASVLRYQAGQGREQRISSFMAGLVVPIVRAGFD